MATGLPTAARRARTPAGSFLGRGQRRPYTRADYRYLARHYARPSATACAQALGRTVGSGYHFLARHPEL